MQISGNISLLENRMNSSLKLECLDIVGTKVWLRHLLQAPPVQMHNNTSAYFSVL